MERRTVDWSSWRHPLRSAWPQTLQTVRAWLFFLNFICPFWTFWLLILLIRFMGVLSHSCEYVPDIFFLSVILFFGTFFTCTFIKSFKFTPFFPTKASQLPLKILSTQCPLRSVASLPTMQWCLPSSSLSLLTMRSTLQHPSLQCPLSWRYKHCHQSFSSMKNLHATFSSQLGQTCAIGGSPWQTPLPPGTSTSLLFLHLVWSLTCLIYSSQDLFPTWPLLHKELLFPLYFPHRIFHAPCTHLFDLLTY